jgi:hypothetical protein
MATNSARQPPQLDPVDPLQRMETEPPPAFLLRTVQAPEQPATPKTAKRWSRPDGTVWIALGIVAVLAVAAGGYYWLFNPGQKQIAAATPAALPTPEPAPSRLVSPPSNNQPPPSEATTPPVAALAPPVTAPTPVAAAEPPPAVAPSPPPVTEQAPAAVSAPEAPQAPAATPDNDVFVVRFDSKLPGLTPTGLRALNAALRAAHAGRKVRIVIEGCDGTDTAPNGVSCAELTRRLKWILTDRGVHHPADLIADSSHP